MGAGTEVRELRNEFTICWDCARATDNACPWVDRGEPVPGWVVKPSTIKGNRKASNYESACVRRCPMFKRDGVNGGQEKYVPYKAKLEYVPLKRGDGAGEKSNNRKHDSSAPESGVGESRGVGTVDSGTRSVADNPDRGTRVLSTDREVLDLAYGIIERAVLDWKALSYGARAECVLDGVFLNRKEVARFFFSEWFKHLCDVTPYTPEQLRAFIHMPEDALEIIEFADAGRRFRSVYQESGL